MAAVVTGILALAGVQYRSQERAKRQGYLDWELREALGQGRLDVAAHLLDQGADPNEHVPSRQAESAPTVLPQWLDELTHGYFRKVTPPRQEAAIGILLEPYKHVVSPIAPQQERLIVHMLRMKADPNVQCSTESALATIARCGSYNLIAKVLSHGANPNIRNSDYMRCTPLMSVALRPGAARLLIRAGARVNDTNESWRTPLSCACISSPPETLQLLIDAGATVDPRDAAGRTPLMRCARVNTPEVVRVLVEAGADVNARTLDGRTVLAAAQGSTCPDKAQIIALLKRHGAKDPSTP